MSVCRFVTRGFRPWAVLVVIGILVCSGCQPGGYSGPTGTVSGTVTLNGEPVPQGCTVVFIADAGHTATGQVGPGGTYSLSVVGKSGKSSAVPVANYKVCVSPPAKEAAESEDYEAMMDRSASGEEQPQAQAPAQQEIIPAAFQSVTTSGLSYEVKEGPNTIDVKLE